MGLLYQNARRRGLNKLLATLNICSLFEGLRFVLTMINIGINMLRLPFRPLRKYSLCVFYYVPRKNLPVTGENGGRK